jgi:hypothetical protein
MIERSSYRSVWWGQEVQEIRFRQELDTYTPGDRRAIRFVVNEWDEDDEDFKPQYQWSLQNYFSFGWGMNPFHLRSNEEDLLRYNVFFTEEEALAFVESGAAPVAIRNILEKRHVE